MNKTITLTKEDWETVIEGLSYATEEADESGEFDRGGAYTSLIDLITEKLDN